MKPTPTERAQLSVASRGAARAVTPGCPTERVIAMLDREGGEMTRAAAFRELAPILGLKASRRALGQSIADGFVTLDDLDHLHLVR